MTPRRLIAVLAVALAAAVLAACGAGDGASASGARPVVVATTTQVGAFARAVGGDRAAVRQILQPNSDPHQYEPRPSDVQSIAGASVVVRSGADIDQWLQGVLDNAGSHVKPLTLIDVLHTRRLHGQTDPHWWQNPRNAIIAVGEIRDALIAADPAGRKTYTDNADTYIAKLRALDTAIASCVAKVPRRERKLVTDHDAMGYYADRYAITVIGTVIPALSTNAQASARQVTHLIHTIRAAGVSTIFSESSVNPKLTRAIAHEAGAKVGPPLYADTLGPAGSDGATYIGSLKANTQALISGFTAGRRSCRL
jgi:ABC-type Zn uptake system ZnuABC Zn-binding protein ZnuA